MTNSFIIGGISGCISQTIMWPIEYMKTIKQLPEYKNLLITKTFIKDIKTNGFISIYRGLAPQLTSAIPRTAMRYAVFDHLKNHFKDKNGNITNFQKLSFGMIAGASEAITITTPAEVVKVQLVNNNSEILNTLKNFYKKNGLPGFYKGSMMTTIRQSTNHGITFLTVENLRPLFNNMDYINAYSGLFAGSIGGSLAVLLNNPIDVIKTYKQSDRLNDSTIKIIKEIYQKKGVPGFYSGLVLRTLRVGPMYGISFYIYDSLAKYFEI
jgi:solute carrier family 25 protein 34/35